MRISVVMVAVVWAGCASGGEEQGWSTEEQEAARTCELVRCFAPPLCAEGQHAIYTPNDCCGRCVGPNTWASRCANVLCAALECPEGEQRVYRPGQCCGVCVPVPAETCGANTCSSDEYCCNESCGTCAPLDGFCTQEVCAGGI